jgi:hypothetical protein
MKSDPLKMSASRFHAVVFVCLISVFVSCEQPIQSGPSISIAQVDSVSNAAYNSFTDDQSDSLWIRDAIDLWSRFFLDTARSRIVLINEMVSRVDGTYPPHYQGDFYYLEYEVDHDTFYMRYCLNGINWIQSIWYEDQLVFLEESCFNYAWSSCGIGFNRRSIFRNGRLIDEWWRTAGDRTKEEFDGDVCNCLTPMDFDQLAELHKKCRFHHDSK